MLRASAARNDTARVGWLAWKLQDDEQSRTFMLQHATAQSDGAVGRKGGLELVDDAPRAVWGVCHPLAPHSVHAPEHRALITRAP
jgi:hypothetical protein